MHFDSNVTVGRTAPVLTNFRGVIAFFNLGAYDAICISVALEFLGVRFFAILLMLMFSCVVGICAQERAAVIGHTEALASLVYSPDGIYLATASDHHTAKVWDATGIEVITIKGHSATVEGVAFSPDGKILATGSYDGTVKLWNRAAGTELATYSGHTALIRSLAYSPDSKTVASGSHDNTIILWDVATGKERAHLKEHKGTVRFLSHDGNVLASGSNDYTVKLWDALTGKEFATMRDHDLGVRGGVLFSVDDKTLVTGSMDSTVRFWDIATRTEKVWLGASSEILSIALSPDGNLVAGGGQDYSLKLWDAVSGQKLANLENTGEQVRGLTFSLDENFGHRHEGSSGTALGRGCHLGG